MPNPNDILDDLTRDEVNMAAEIDRLKRVKQLFEKNRYDGKYKDQFEDVYEDILEARDLIEEDFEDGFQFSDLEEVIVTATPVLKRIYDEFYDTMKSPKEAQKFLRDLILFIYYEVESRVKVWGWLKGLFRLVLRIWVAKKLAKYLKIAFDYVDNRISILKDKTYQKIQGYLSELTL